MKLRALVLLPVVLAGVLLAGCAKEPEATATQPAKDAPFFGDSQSKIVYRNVGPKVNEVPDDRKVYFKSEEEATAAGYKSEAEAKLGVGDEE